MDSSSDGPAESSRIRPQRAGFARARGFVKSTPVRVAAWTIVGLLVVPGLFYAFPQIVGRDGAYVVLSGSMVPFFRAGDVIFVDSVPSDSLQVGDVVTFRAKPGSNVLITHRVTEVLEEGGRVRYRTQGDANSDPDPFLVTPEMVVGKYAFQIPFWGHLLNVVRSKVGYVLFVVIPAGTIIIREFVRLYRELDAWDRSRTARKRAEGEGPSP